MNEIDKAIKAIIRTMNEKCKHYIGKATFDKTYQGRINNNLGNGSYMILIYNNEYEVKSETGRANIPVGSVVKVVAPQNDFNAIFIY